jgi:hypothetical protein
VTPPSVGESLLEETDESGSGPLDLIQWLQPDLLIVERADAGRDSALIRSLRNRAGVVVLGIDAERWEPGAAEPAKGAGGTPAKGAGTPGVDPRVAGCVDIVVEVTPLVDGSTRTIRIGERAADGGDPFALTTVFEFFVAGATESGELSGEYRSTRTVPRFVERRKARGKRVDMSLFQG